MVDLTVTTLVDQFASGLQVRETISNERFNQTKHVDGGLVQLDEDTILDLAQTEKLQNLANLRGNTHDTTDTYYESYLSFRSYEQVAIGLGLTTQTDVLVFDLAVFLYVLFSRLESNGAN